MLMLLPYLGGCADTKPFDVQDNMNNYKNFLSVSSQMMAVDADRPDESTEKSDNELEIGGGKNKDDNTPEILRFVDVYGEEYQVEINPNVLKHEYDNSGYTRDGQNLLYEDEKYTSRQGIDVSHHQGHIDWEKVADQGIEFAILRIGYRGYGEEGKIKADTRFSEYIKGAKEAGLDVGVYFFAQAVNEEEAIEEADFVLSMLEEVDIMLPVVYDPESILDDDARTDDVSGEQFTKNTIAFCNRVKEAGYDPMVYANMLWEAYELDLSQLEGIPIWYADYEPLPQTPYHFEYLQYSNEGIVQGVSGVCDLDIQIIEK